jgi:hypothetical protein
MRASFRSLRSVPTPCRAAFSACQRALSSSKAACRSAMVSRRVARRACELLDLQAHEPAVELVELDRRRVDLHLEPRAGLVDEVDRLVGQLPARDVPVRQGGGGHEGAVGDGDAVVRLVPLLEAAEDRHGVLDAGLADVHLLEPTLESGVLLDVLAVLVERGRTDEAQLAAGQHGLEHVGRGDRPLAAARAHEGVELVDEGDDLAVALRDLLEDVLEAFLELAAVLGAGDEGRQVEADQALVLEAVGDVAGDDALGEPLDDGGLADAGLADQHGVVLGAACEHLADAADLGVAADDGVERAAASDGGEVDAVLLERALLLLGGGRSALHVRHGCAFLENLSGADSSLRRRGRSARHGDRPDPASSDRGGGGRTMRA